MIRRKLEFKKRRKKEKVGGCVVGVECMGEEQVQKLKI